MIKILFSSIQLSQGFALLLWGLHLIGQFIHIDVFFFNIACWLIARTKWRISQRISTSSVLRAFAILIALFFVTSATTLVNSATMFLTTNAILPKTFCWCLFLVPFCWWNLFGKWYNWKVGKLKINRFSFTYRCFGLWTTFPSWIHFLVIRKLWWTTSHLCEKICFDWKKTFCKTSVHTEMK